MITKTKNDCVCTTNFYINPYTPHNWLKSPLTMIVQTQSGCRIHISIYTEIFPLRNYYILYIRITVLNNITNQTDCELVLLHLFEIVV